MCRNLLIWLICIHLGFHFPLYDGYPDRGAYDYDDILYELTCFFSRAPTSTAVSLLYSHPILPWLLGGFSYLSRLYATGGRPISAQSFLACPFIGHPEAQLDALHPAFENTGFILSGHVDYSALTHVFHDIYCLNI
jgi:hypothetical protein